MFSETFLIQQSERRESIPKYN